MQHVYLKAGATSQVVEVDLWDKSKTDASRLTGLVYNTASLVCYKHRAGAASGAAVSLVDMTLGTFTSGGFKVVDGTNMPGRYQFCPPDADLATGAAYCDFTFRGAASLAQEVVRVHLSVAADVVAVSGDATAADNLEADYDGTGYAKTASTTKLHSDYDAAKTAAAAGAKMDLIDAPNATALAAIKTALEAAGSTLATLLSRIVGTLLTGNHSPQTGDAYAVVNHATYGNSALNTLLVTTGIKAASIPAVTGATLHSDYDAAKTAASQTSVDNLNDFDPATDVVAHVTLVDRTIENDDALEWLYVPPAP